MGKDGGSGGAGGALGLLGGGGQIRRTILSRNLEPADEIFFANPDKRQVKQRRKAYEESIERGRTPTLERALATGNLRATVRRKVPGTTGYGYELEIRRGSETLVEKFSKKTGGKARRSVRRVIVGPNELRGAKVVRDGKWAYKVNV